MKLLFVYGMFCFGCSNVYILEVIGGEWCFGYVIGIFYVCGWGVVVDFLGIVFDVYGLWVNGYLFLFDWLVVYWFMLDDFEEGYDWVLVEVIIDDGQQISVWIYQFQFWG